MLNLKKWMTKVSEKLAEKTGTVTSDYSINTSITTIRTFGPLAFLTLYLTIPANTTVASYGSIAKISSGFIPIKQIFGAAKVGSSLNPYDITGSGYIRLAQGFTTSAITEVALSAVYIVGG